MKFILILSLLLSWLSGAAITDEVHLVNGKVYKVRSWRVDGDYLIMITVDGKNVKIRRERVKKIDVDLVEKSLDTGEISTATKRRSQLDTELPPPKEIAIPDRVYTQITRGNIAAALSELDATGNGFQLTSDYSFLRGTLLIRAGYFVEAENIITTALERDPYYPAGRFLLAQALYYQGRWDEAEEQYQAALQVNPPPEITSQLSRKLGEIKSYRDGQVLSRGSLLIRVAPIAIDQGRLDSAVGILLLGVDTASRILVFQPPQKLLVIISGGSTSHYSRASDVGNYDGRISISASVLSSPQRKEILVHELAHALILPRTKANCPVWLQEGLAQLISGKKIEEFGDKLSAFVKNTSAGLDAYPDSLSLTEYLIQHYGNEKLTNLLDRLAAGVEVEDALRVIYGADYRSLLIERDDWLRLRFEGYKQ